MIFEFEGKRPRIGEGTYVHPEATIIGDVVIGEGCFIGAGARLRGDWGSIEIGPQSNIQENCVIHVHPGHKAVMGARSHIGHGAMLHTPVLGEHVTIGMGAIVMNFCDIGDGCLIGAGALVMEKSVIPPYKLVVGLPGKIIGDINEAMRASLEAGTEYYIGLPPRCLGSIKQLELEEVLTRKQGGNA